MKRLNIKHKCDSGAESEIYVSPGLAPEGQLGFILMERNATWGQESSFCGTVLTKENAAKLCDYLNDWLSEQCYVSAE